MDLLPANMISMELSGMGNRLENIHLHRSEPILMPTKSLRSWAHQLVTLFLVIRRITEATMLKASLYTSISQTMGTSQSEWWSTKAMLERLQNLWKKYNKIILIPCTQCPPAIRLTSLTHHCYFSVGTGGSWLKRGRKRENLHIERCMI